MYKFLINFSILLLTITDISTFATESVAKSLEVQNFIENLENTKNTIHGGAIAILLEGKVIYKTTFGKQNGELGPITNKTLFPLASVSKPISAMAIALLVEQNKISLDELFKLPYLKNHINLSHILSHTTSHTFSGNSEIEQGMSKEKILNILQKDTPICNPGECYKYSNIIFSLIDEALNKKNLSLREAFENLRYTLKTQDIQILPLDPTTELAYPHSKKTIKNVSTIKSLPVPPYYPKASPAASGVFASIDGMIEIFKLSFGYMPEVISQKTLDRMHTPVIKVDDIFNWGIKLPIDKNLVESYYALGWRILKIKNTPGKELIFHGGHIKGINTFIGFIPFKKIGIIILANQDSSFPMSNGLLLWSLFISENS